MNKALRATFVAATVAATACARAGAVEPASPPEPPAAPAPAPDPTPPAPPSVARGPEPIATGPGGIAVLPGSILPRERIVAFYGNPRSPLMGILGELPPDQVLARLDREVAAWRRADPATPVRPALHMIAVMATADAGADGKYRLRQPAVVIEEVLEWAARRDAIVFLDIQPGRSPVAEELRHLLPYLRRPEVHLALDPEWRMHGDAVPGERIGSMNAEEVNHAIDALAKLVDEEALPPKVLVVHRFTGPMLTDADRIRVDPRVQVVLNMDGWGPPSAKIDSYRSFVASAPVPYKGFKLFYKNDRRGGSPLMTPEEVLALSPAPVYIQYQ